MASLTEGSSQSFWQSSGSLVSACFTIPTDFKGFVGGGEGVITVNCEINIKIYCSMITVNCQINLALRYLVLWLQSIVKSILRYCPTITFKINLQWDIGLRLGNCEINLGMLLPSETACSKRPQFSGTETYILKNFTQPPLETPHFLTKGRVFQDRFTIIRSALCIRPPDWYTCNCNHIFVIVWFWWIYKHRLSCMSDPGPWASLLINRNEKGPRRISVILGFYHEKELCL